MIISNFLRNGKSVYRGGGKSTYQTTGKLPYRSTGNGKQNSQGNGKQKSHKDGKQNSHFKRGKVIIKGNLCAFPSLIITLKNLLEDWEYIASLREKLDLIEECSKG